MYISIYTHTHRATGPTPKMKEIIQESKYNATCFNIKD